MGLLDNANKPMLLAGLGMMANGENPFQGGMQGLLTGLNYNRQTEMDALAKKRYQNQQNYQNSVLAMQRQKLAMQQAKHQTAQNTQNQFNAAFTAGQNGQMPIQTQFPTATPQELAVAKSLGSMADANKFLMGRVDARNKPVQARYVKAVDGKHYYIDGPKAGQRVLANVQEAPSPAFAGKGMEANAANIVLEYQELIRSGKQPTEKQKNSYQIALSILNRPTTVTTPSGTLVQPGINTTGFAQPQTPSPTQAGQPNTPPTEAAQGNPNNGSPVSPSPFGFTPKEKQFPQHMTSAAGYAKRMDSAEQTLNKITSTGYDPTSISENVRGITNVTATKEHQQYDQAKKDWARAKLRDESGAVISEEEIENEIETYFPVFGDSPEVVAQKEAARKLATQGMIESAGGAYVPPTASNPQKEIKKEDGNEQSLIARATRTQEIDGVKYYMVDGKWYTE